MKGTNKPKLFIIGRLNLKSKAKKWFKELHATHVDWWAMKVGMLLKYKTIDKEEIKVELDVFKQNPKQWVQAYNGKIVHKRQDWRC